MRGQENCSFQMTAGRDYQDTAPPFIASLLEAVHFKHNKDQIYSFLMVLFVVKCGLNVKKKRTEIGR